jgi:LysM repeat protein
MFVHVVGSWSLGFGIVAQSLLGSAASLDAQNERAVLNKFTYLETRSDVTRFVTSGYLEKLPGSPDYRLYDVSYPVARPEVRLFVERLSAQYRHACGEPLIVTSLTRPKSEQPDNASPRSVHPTGMALDLRRPRTGACRAWLERTLLSLESRSVLDVTLEHVPAHLHVALFPRSYASYVASLAQASVAVVVASRQATRTYTVRAADTLWAIAKRFKTTAAALRTANKLASDVIRAGQRLAVPIVATVTKHDGLSR